MRGSFPIQSAASQALKTNSAVISSAHTQAATTILRQQKMLARENMKSLSEVFVEGERAEVKIAQRKARNQAVLNAAHVPNFAAAIAGKHNSKSLSDKAVIKANGEPAHIMQPVMSAADRYRQARISGEPLSSAATASASAASHAHNSAAAGGSSSIPLMLLLGLGLGGAYAVHQGYGFFSVPPTATATPAKVQLQATKLAAAPVHMRAVETTMLGTSASASAYNSTADADSSATANSKQPLWLQRHR